jgi:hypothetical protein
MQHASKASHGFSPGQPVYMTPQYLPYLKIGGTENREDKNVYHFSEKDIYVSLPKSKASLYFVYRCHFFFLMGNEHNAFLCLAYPTERHFEFLHTCP